MFNHIIESIVVHFFSNKLNEMLVSSNDPSVHDVRVLSLYKLVLESGVENEAVRGSLLPS